MTDCSILSSLNTGEKVNHAFAKEAIAGIVGGEVDKVRQIRQKQTKHI